MAKHAEANQRLRRPKPKDLDKLWSHHHAEWRDSTQIVAQWHGAPDVDPQLLKGTVRGEWWSLIEELGITLLVSREYEHLLVALSASDGSPSVSFLPMPHPSGIAVDRESGTVHVASTRNPNQIYDLKPVNKLADRTDVHSSNIEDKPLVPLRSHFLPGCLYMHDLAMIGGQLHANAVGQNAVIALPSSGGYQAVWWPKSIETPDGPAFGVNYIQLNSIAAGESLAESFFSASSETISTRRPGHRNYPVDKRGVIFSARTREPMVRGLTRPHSARLHGDALWVDNSGYGELVRIDNDNLNVVTKLPGWTRGLCFVKNIAFVGTSRIIPRFAHYAPGLDVNSSKSGIHAVDIRSGQVLGSIYWPHGNQIFAIDWLPTRITGGFPFRAARQKKEEQLLFYTFQPEFQKGEHR